jgi:hypothetical protein
MIGYWYKPTLKLLNSKKLRNEPRYRKYEAQKECLLVRFSIISYWDFFISIICQHKANKSFHFIHLLCTYFA